MSVEYRKASESELSRIGGILESYRRYWRGFSGIFDCDFSGTLTDIEALDYIDYELSPPKDFGAFEVGIVIGNAFVKTGLFDWCVDGKDTYAIRMIDYPELLILPVARVEELQLSPVPQFEKHSWIVAEITSRCFSMGITEDAGRRLLSLLDYHDGRRLLESLEMGVNDAKKALAEIGASNS